MTRRDVLAIVRACLAKEERPTVEIIRNTKGVTIGVRVSARSVAEAGRKAQAEYERLAKVYPAPANGGGD